MGCSRLVCELAGVQAGRRGARAAAGTPACSPTHRCCPAPTPNGRPPPPRSIYIRCKNSVQEALYSQMMAIYFKKDELINDP